MRTVLHSNEVIHREARGCHHFFITLVRGRLFLTNRRLVFESPWRSHEEVIDLGQVTGVRPCWTLLFGVIPILPASLIIDLKGRGSQRFWVSQRDEWIAAIRQATGRD